MSEPPMPPAPSVIGQPHAPFVTRIPVRFADVDYARIIYYPQLFHLLHIAFEELFERHVGIPYAELLGEVRVGFPCANLECDFIKPMRFGDILEISISVLSLGRSSVVFEDVVRVLGPDDVRARARITRVAVDMDTLRPIPIPERLMAPLLALTAGPSATPAATAKPPERR